MVERTIVYDQTWTGTGLIDDNYDGIANGPKTINMGGHIYHRFIIHHSLNPCLGSASKSKPGATCRDCTLEKGCSKPGTKIVYRRVLIPGNPLYEAKLEQLYFGEEFINKGDTWEHVPGDYSLIIPHRPDLP